MLSVYLWGRLTSHTPWRIVTQGNLMSRFWAIHELQNTWIQEVNWFMILHGRKYMKDHLLNEGVITTSRL